MPYFTQGRWSPIRGLTWSRRVIALRPTTVATILAGIGRSAKRAVLRHGDEMSVAHCTQRTFPRPNELLAVTHPPVGNMTC